MLFTILLLCTAFSQALAEQGSAENSIPEPTALGKIASDESVETLVTQHQNSIESKDSIAKIAIVELKTRDGKRHIGIKAQLENSTDLDSLYLDIDQVSQFRDELIGLKYWYEQKLPCDARRCVQGVARCRPSQSITQAFCPAFYSTPLGKNGILISTSRYSFHFPSIEPSAILDVLDDAIAELQVR